MRRELHFDADYIRGRRIKTRIAVRANGTVSLENIGRGKAVLRWLERCKEESCCNWLANDGYDGDVDGESSHVLHKQIQRRPSFAREAR